MSIGAIDLMGCVTNVTEYSRAMTMTNKIMVTATTTKPQIRTSNSSAVSRCFWCWFINLFLQYGGHEILRALLCKQALGLLALRIYKMVWVLTSVAIPVFAGGKASYGKQQGK